ncbi:MAG: TRAP transporter fused permease subunit [Dehalococcoidales bacterium]|nr:TRAP transporter fused permease subunit [Dehalococcoidales bacterium]
MRKLGPSYRKFLAVVGLAWAFFTIYTAFAIARHPVVQGPIFLTFAVIIVFSYYPMTKWELDKRWPPLLDILAMLITIAVCVRAVLNYEVFTRLYYQFTMVDVACSVLLLIIAMEGARRAYGWIIPILVVFFFSYLIWGKFIPGTWGHPGFDVYAVLARIYRGSDGYWGSMTWVVSTIVAIFIFLGPVLVASGAGKAIMNFAYFFAGKMPGGAAQVAVVGSSLFGTISGSAVANVAAVGTITIPTMKKAGYSSSFAGAVEATASTGGQIMPPVMGAAAFIMAQFLTMPYRSIAWAALIPALMYYYALMTILYFHAKIHRIGSLPPELIPKAKEVLDWRNLVSFAIPVGVLLGILAYTFIPQLAGAGAVVTAALLYILTGARTSLGQVRKYTVNMGTSLISGANQLSTLIVLVVAIEVLIFSIDYTGLGVKLSELIISVGRGSLMLSLLLSMVTTIVLGMGMATTPSYVIAIAVLEAPLVKLGLTPLTAHMFIFYFAVIGAITPPVCPASFTAATIARTGWGKLSLIACALGLTGFIVPFLFVYEPALLMQGTPAAIISALVPSILGIFAISAAALGYYVRKMKLLERLALGVGGLLLFAPTSMLPNLIGFGLMVAVFLIELLRGRSQAKEVVPVK